MSYLILEMSEAERWGAPWNDAGQIREIPLNRRPRMLQPDRETAEREAKRLAERHPGCRFVVFAPVAAGITATVPTHINISGKVLMERRVATVVTLDAPDDIPF